ncbi:hypothetical protein MKX08_001318 [Trichoderma sp. CBMAI-0020]|nr:hypothetical protein MKX08_001318 [Trichoderma sp. CBMAI-0020]
MKILHTFILTAFMLIALVSGQFSKEDKDNHVIAGEPARYLIALSAEIQRWVTEEEKWELKLSGHKFIDITGAQDSDSEVVNIQSPWDNPVRFPWKCVMQEQVKELAGNLSKDAMRENLHKLNGFYNRYYKSDYGKQSSEWVLERVRGIIKEAGADGAVTATPFTHSWPQISTIARIQGRTNDTIIIGAHQDSLTITPYDASKLPAAGPGDDGSGAVTIMEVFRALLIAKDVAGGLMQNTVEFHWYSAESVGLLGSQAIFRSYRKKGRKVKAMIQQDMVGYIHGALNAGSKPESLAVVRDVTHFGLNAFIKTVIDEYCDVPWIDSKCSFACSAHHAAAQAGYPSAFVTDFKDPAFDRKDEHVETRHLLKYISYDHMLQHAKMSLGLVYELARFKFSNVTS